MPEIIPRTKSRPPWWINLILAVALISLIAAVGGQIFFRISAKDLDRKIEDVKQQIVDLRTPVNQEMEKQLLTYQTQFKNFSQLLSQRYLTSKALDLLETTIHPEVLYENFMLDASEGKIRMLLSAQNYGIIGEQLMIFNNDSRLKRVETSNYERDKDGLITFRVILDFIPSIIQ